MVAIAQPTLSPDYTKKRPIGYLTSNAKASLSILDILWITREWLNFQGGPEDYDFSVIMEVTTPTGIRVWVHDRDEESKPILMLPEDY
jgi:hypothetical protein